VAEHGAGTELRSISPSLKISRFSDNGTIELPQQRGTASFGAATNRRRAMKTNANTTEPKPTDVQDLISETRKFVAFYAV
jgi:hypothetical protein